MHLLLSTFLPLYFVLVVDVDGAHVLYLIILIKFVVLNREVGLQGAVGEFADVGAEYTAMARGIKPSRRLFAIDF